MEVGILDQKALGGGGGVRLGLDLTWLALQ
jgi:hypothetical protein